VKFPVRDIEAAAKERRFDEPTHELGRLLAEPVQDFRLPSTLTVAVNFYRAGQDLFFQGRITGQLKGQCSRCVEDYTFPLAVDFNFVFVPRHEVGAAGEEEDADLTYYEGEEIDLSPMLQEQVLLALPTRPLCRENCAGLCPQCGANRNLTTCKCQPERGDPRLAVLRTLKVHS
jgi:uncharacterized protein